MIYIWFWIKRSIYFKKKASMLNEISISLTNCQRRIIQNVWHMSVVMSHRVSSFLEGRKLPKSFREVKFTCTYVASSMWCGLQHSVTTLKTDPHYLSLIPFYPLWNFTHLSSRFHLFQYYYLASGEPLTSCASTSWMSNPTPEALALDMYTYIYM